VKPSDGLPNQEKNQYWTIFIDRNKGFIYKTVKPNEEGKTETTGKVNAGMKTMAACLEWLTLLGRKDKLSAACLKRLWAWKVKNIVVRKIGYLSKYSDNLVKI